jgi:parallel beta-helix repeat protein
MGMHRNLVVCSVAILIVLGGFLNFVGMYDIGISEPEIIVTQLGGYRGTHKRIMINNNSDFVSIATSESWIGNGTVGNPYIIENLTIDANGGWHCIYIGNTTVHFIIRNCTLTGATRRNHPYAAGHGILLSKIKNGKIQSNNITGNNIGMRIYWSDNIDIENNNCSDNGNWTNDCGIDIYYSKYVVIKNNICHNMSHGIVTLSTCSDITIENNICNLNENNGIACVRLANSRISNNTCNNNTWGVSCGISGNSNLIINNTCLSNRWYGLDLGGGNGLIKNNNFSKNGFAGIRLMHSDFNIIDNNYCSDNEYGIFLYLCNNNTIINNSCINNTKTGIGLRWSDFQTIRRNICLLNKFAGIHLDESDKVNISLNNISYNQNGIHLEDDTNNNLMIENLIAYNTNFGIRLGKEFPYCHVYHNNILSNKIQASSQHPNNWDNGNGEGNYWDDYTGLDNGANGRTAGDGIGDTKLPHPDTLIDNYPFMNYSGWLEPLSPPNLNDPGEFDFDGNYVVNWGYYPRADNYILQEDTSTSFNSPVTLYNGKQFFYNINNKENGTYYYRLKAYNILEYTPWSNIVDVTVDMIPSIPSGLKVKNIKGHAVTLSWNANPEPDLGGYHIFMNITNGDANGPFDLIKTVSKTITQIDIRNLLEKTTYYFVITAYDTILSNSSFSQVLSATTLDETPPKAPTGLKAKAISGSSILLNWNSSMDSDLAGYIIYMNDTGVSSFGSFHIINTTKKTVTSTLIEDLVEETIYYFIIRAFDEVPNNSSYSNIAFATTPDETPPAAPKGLAIVKSTHDSLVLNWEANSEDDLVGYFLFKAKSSNEQFFEINSKPLTKTTYMDTDLDELTTYYYKVRAMDDAGWNSSFSEQVIGKTLEKEKAPTVNNILSNIEMLEDSIDDSIDLQTAFSDPNSDPLTYNCVGQEYIGVTIDSKTSKVVLQPEPDWSGEETLTFFATDGISEISQTINVRVTPVNDPPGPAQILDPQDGIEINEETGIAFYGICSDPDLPYGDELIYRWTSSIDGALGLGTSLNNIVLSSGKHEIILVVTDDSGINSTTSISVNVVEKPAKKETDKGEDLTSIIVVIIVLLVVFITLLMLFWKGKT